MGGLPGILIHERLHGRPFRWERHHQWAFLFLKAMCSFRVRVLVECFYFRHPHRHCHKMSCPVVLCRADKSLYFCKCENSFLCICLHAPDRVDSLCSMQALHLSMLCNSFVYLLTWPNRKHKNNLFTIWKRNYSKASIKDGVFFSYLLFDWLKCFWDSI